MTDDNDADPLKAGQQECESKVPCEGESEGGRRQTAEMTNRNRLEDLWRQISFQTKQSSMFSEFLTGSDTCTEEMRCLETSPCRLINCWLLIGESPVWTGICLN